MPTEPLPDHPGLFTPSFIANPYPAYHAIRELGRPYWFPYDGEDACGMWLFAGYADVDALLKETHRTTNDISPFLPAGAVSPLKNTMLQSDPPEHTRRRKQMGDHFSAHKLKTLETHIARIVDDRIAAASTARADCIDFVEDFAAGIPLTVGAELLGIPASDLTSLRDWSWQMSEGLDSIRPDDGLRRRQQDAARKIQACFARWLEDPSCGPQENTLFHDLLQGYRLHASPGRDELLATLMLLFIASHENITNMLGNGLLALLQHPLQMQRLQAEPGCIDAAVEEMLRYDGSVQRANLRVAVDEIEICGRIFHRGDHLSPLLGAANRDPARFSEPDAFDISRTPGRHLAFGTGPHVCPGAALARMQLRIAFTRLLRAWPDIRLAGLPQWKPNSVIRGLRHLPVQLRA